MRGCGVVDHGGEISTDTGLEVRFQETADHFICTVERVLLHDGEWGHGKVFRAQGYHPVVSSSWDEVRGESQFELRYSFNTRSDDSLRMRDGNCHGLVQEVAVETDFRRLAKNLNHPDVLLIYEVSMLDYILFDKIETIYATARIQT